MSLDNYRMRVRKGFSGADENPEGIDVQYLLDDDVTPADIFETVEFRAEFPRTAYDGQRKVMLTEGAGVTVDRTTGDISVDIDTNTFSAVQVPDGKRRKGSMVLSHIDTDGTRAPIIRGTIILEDTLYA